MTTITRERLQKLIRAIDCGSYDEEEIVEWVNSDEILELARIALATRDAKPVAWTDEQELRDVDESGIGYLFAVNPITPYADPRRVIKLYTVPPALVVHQEPIAWLNDAYLARGVVDGEAGSEDAGPGYIPVYREPLYAVQPAPAVPEEATPDNIEVLASARVDSSVSFQWDENERNAAADSWNACRAAPLQGSQLVSNRDELLPGIKPAPELDSVAKNAESLPGNSPVIGWLRSDYNSDDKRDPNAPLFMLGSNDPSETWGVKYIPLSGNSPVIPDCSEDTKRLDWLDYQNKRLNEYYGTAYGWKFDANFQRNAMMLNDSNYPVMTVRQAIDQAIASAPQQEVNRE